MDSYGSALKNKIKGLKIIICEDDDNSMPDHKMEMGSDHQVDKELAPDLHHDSAHHIASDQMPEHMVEDKDMEIIKALGSDGAMGRKPMSLSERVKDKAKEKLALIRQKKA